MNSRERAEKILQAIQKVWEKKGYYDKAKEIIAAELDAHAEEAIEEVKKERESIGYTKGYLESKNAVWNAAIEEVIQKTLDIESMSKGSRWYDIRGEYWIPEFIKVFRALKKTEEK